MGGYVQAPQCSSHASEHRGPKEQTTHGVGVEMVGCWYRTFLASTTRVYQVFPTSPPPRALPIMTLTSKSPILSQCTVHHAPAAPVTSSRSLQHFSIAALQFGLGRLERRHQHVSHVVGRLVEVEAHSLTAQFLGHDVELQTVASRVSIRDIKRNQINTYLFSLIIYAIPHP